MITDRDYQPSLLWAKAVSWYESQPLDHPPGPNDLALYVYRTDKTGAYYMHGPKLYWSDEPMSGSHFRNIEQSDLADNHDELAEVVLHDRRNRKTVMLGKFPEAIEKIS